MNWLLIAVILVLCIYTIKGYHNGLIRVVFSLVSIFIVIAFVTWATPYIADFLENNTTLLTSIQEKCEQHIQDSAAETIDAEAEENAQSLETAGIQLPSSVQDKLIDNSASVVGEFMEDSGLYSEMAGAMAHFIIKGIAFFVALIVAFLLMRTLGGILNIVSHLPIIHGINRILGLAAGFVQGMILVWLFMYLVAICCTSGFGMIMIRFINQSTFLTYLYNNNGLLDFLVKIF